MVKIPFFSYPYSLRKSRHVLKTCYDAYRKKGKQLSSTELHFFESNLTDLDQKILQGNRIEADHLAHIVEDFCQKNFKKSIWNYLLEFTLAIVIALLVAAVVRQTWFELYEIPTGSMRPTFKEQDHLTVTKTSFSLNIPLITKHFYFNSDLVKRIGIVIWSGDGVNHLNSDSTFMGIFPYTKRYIKRCLGKPGDILYFYGGKIYGFDKEGNELTELRESPWMDKLEHIPFVDFEGRPSLAHEFKQFSSNTIIFHHINQAIGRLTLNPSGLLRGEIFNGKEWVKDKPESQRTPHTTIQTYSDFWGIRNFALSRLLTKEQVEKLTSHDLKAIEEGSLYLELYHTPSLDISSLILSKRGIPFIKGFSTLIPLQQQHLQALMENMYTSRFVIRNEKVARYEMGEVSFSPSSPLFPGIPDGTYEFYYGKAFQIGWGGVETLLSQDHPLYQMSSNHIQKLFNLGILFSNHVEPSKNQFHFPNRYTYFREGDLYLLGAPILKKDDLILKTFREREFQKEQLSTPRNPYVAFKDYGPPLTEDGKLDKEFIKIW